MDLQYGFTLWILHTALLLLISYLGIMQFYLVSYSIIKHYTQRLQFIQITYTFFLLKISDNQHFILI